MSPKVDSIKRESTSIKIRPDVWKNAKIEAIKQDKDLSQLVEDAIQAYINNRSNRRNQNE